MGTWFPCLGRESRAGDRSVHRESNWNVLARSMCTKYKGSANLSCNGPGVQYFWLWGPYSVSVTTAPLCLESHHRQYVNEQVWLSINKTLCVETSRFNLWAVVGQSLVHAKRNYTSNRGKDTKKTNRYLNKAKQSTKVQPKALTK